MSALLEIENLSRSFGGLRALSDVSFTVGEGEIVSVIGPNGAGKTTLFNVISGVMPPSAGDVRFNGRSLVGMPSHAIAEAGIGRTYQVVRPFVRLDVLDNVAVGALLHERTLAQARKAAEKVLAMVGLAHLAGAPASSLTLTQRKRLEVARALATRPKLLLLDEVMAGLNPTEIDSMCAFILGLREHGIAAIGAIEHLMRVVMNVSQRIVVLDFGRKIAEGTPAEIAAHPDVIAAYFGSELSVG
ncbi:MAG: ABC transporter ATP-binding protein [Candidatus Eremiobacteraeota bacterium]|nr:ABC transporter ATP-binding protein [Candidatus Eremiobacteraeota bacterium]